MRVLPILNPIQRAQQRLLDDLPHLRSDLRLENVILKLPLEVLLKLLLEEHVPLDVGLIKVLIVGAN